MCGIAGIIQYKGLGRDDIDAVKKMNTIQKHRGPDDEGLYHDQICVLGHRRLSIIDLSQNGHQPFFSDDNRFRLIYNGEIYNYIELREELITAGWKFRTQTDTEVLLKAYQHFGPECLNKFNGMFAFVIYDTQKQTLFLARDRVGVKPLYYQNIGSALYFSSEVKALCALEGLTKTLNRQALFDYMVFNRTDIYDETFFEEIKRLPKGHYAFFTREGLSITQWWDPLKFDHPATENDLNDVCRSIEDILLSAVKLRMRSDVPVGSCLSGGLDSSTLLGILFQQGLAKNEYQTFTASFPGHAIDETKYIKILQKKYHFLNHRTFPTAETAYKNLNDFVYTNDEPTTGPSFYAQYEVMRLARENKVTVLINGQGGDENFAGYQYFHGFYLNGLLKKKQIIKFCMEFIRTLLRGQDKTAYQTFLFQVLPDKTKKELLYNENSYLQRNFYDHHISKSRIYNEFFDADSLNKSLIRHFQYKLEHLLRMEDRNSMAFSLETRLPFLDYRLIEYILSVSDELKIYGGETKFLQKKAVGHYSIPEIIHRKDKIGFGTPAKEWMNSPSWLTQTKKSANYCECLPDVFKKDLFKQIPNNQFNYWKINQLAVWHQIFNV